MWLGLVELSLISFFFPCGDLPEFIVLVYVFATKYPIWFENCLSTIAPRPSLVNHGITTDWTLSDVSMYCQKPYAHYLTIFIPTDPWVYLSDDEGLRYYPYVFRGPKSTAWLEYDILKKSRNNSCLFRKVLGVAKRIAKNTLSWRNVGEAYLMHSWNNLFALMLE